MVVKTSVGGIVVSIAAFHGGEDLNGLHNILSTSITPFDVGGISLLEDGDGLSIDDKLPVLSLDCAVEFVMVLTSWENAQLNETVLLLKDTLGTKLCSQKENAFHISYISAAWNSSTASDFQEALSLQPSNSGMASYDGNQGPYSNQPVIPRTILSNQSILDIIFIIPPPYTETFKAVFLQIDPQRMGPTHVILLDSNFFHNLSLRRLVILATSSLLTSNIFCTDELMMSNLHSKENYDKYSEMSAPTVNKMPHSAANLPLSFGRTVEEERSTGVMANLPLRFGRNIKESISRHVPNLPQRFGRTAAKSVAKTLSDLLQQSMHSPSASELLYSMNCPPQEIQNPDQKHP
ncbi:hypothetical protein GH733_013362, partial [Mirounga leonina]